MRPDRNARPEYVAAFRELVDRIAKSLVNVPAKLLPIRMYVAGGAALHFYTGERVSKDVDATFSRRIALPENLEVAYRDADGGARLLYFDRQYNVTLGLLHEDAYDDSVPLSISGFKSAAIEVRLLSSLDLAVSKIGRFASQDRDDIVALARRKLIESKALRRRAEVAVGGHVGDTVRLRTSIDLACRLVEDVERRRGTSR